MSNLGDTPLRASADVYEIHGKCDPAAITCRGPGVNLFGVAHVALRI